MNSKGEIIKMICPRCKKAEPTIGDVDDPPGTAMIELPCSLCLDSDDNLSCDPVYRDRSGVQLFATGVLPLRKFFTPGTSEL